MKMMSDNPYLRLIRFHAPAGTLLLMWPPLWTLVLLADKLPITLMLLFAGGAFLMRSCGCIINDLTDSALDSKIERTKNRPLASGVIPRSHAYVLLALLLAAAAVIAFMLGIKVFIASFFVLPLIILYPWMKRITFWPQLFLGITFNYGVILASIALTGGVHPSAILIYLGSILWTLGYDTIYGYQDIIDDEKAGIKSTARLFGNNPKLPLAAIYMGAIICWALAGYVLQQAVWYYAFLAFVAAHFIWQVKTLDTHNPVTCNTLFTSNAWLGGVMLAGLFVIKMASQ